MKRIVYNPSLILLLLLIVHFSTPEIKSITEKGIKAETIKVIKFLKAGGRNVVFQLGSEKYDFTIK